MTRAICYVHARDYVRYWGQRSADVVTLPVKAWDGVERRTGVKDRRSGQHDRRWQAEVGRRYGFADRRRTP